MCNTRIYPTHVLHSRTCVLHMYLAQMTHTCISTYVIHLKYHTCITIVTQHIMYHHPMSQTFYLTMWKYSCYYIYLLFVTLICSTDTLVYLIQHIIIYGLHMPEYQCTWCSFGKYTEMVNSIVHFTTTLALSSLFVLILHCYLVYRFSHLSTCLRHMP